MPSRPWSAAAMLVAVAATVVITLAHPSSTRQFTWPWILLLHAVWLAPLAALAIEWIGGGRCHLPGRTVLAGLGLLAVATLVAAATSPFSAASLPHVWPTLGGVAALLWLHGWLGRAEPGGARRRRLLHGLAAGAALLVLASLAGWAGRPGEFNWAVRNDFPFGHSIQLAGALLLLLPWALAVAWTSAGFARVAWLVLTTIGGLMLVVTSSRSAVLAAGAVAAAGTAWAVLRARWSSRAKLGLALAALVILCGAVLANPRLRDLVRGGAWSEVARESNTQRAAMIEAGRLMGAARPWTGWGPGTVPLVYPEFRHRLSGGVDNVLQLHNTPAQLWATLGLPGAAALLLLLVAAARRIRQLWRDPAPGISSLAAAAGLGGYGLFALTDHQLDLPALNALLVVNAALLLSGAPGAREVNPSRAARVAVAAAFFVGLLVPLPSTLRDLTARFQYDRALPHLAAGRMDAALANLEAAAKQAPHDPYYRHQLAGALLRQLGTVTDAATRARLVERARGELMASLSSGAFTEFARFNLGWLALELGAPGEAAGHFRATLREAPHRRGAYFGLGLALRGLGPAHEAGAVRAFALEWLNEPAACAAPLWTWPDFAPLRPEIEAEARRLLGEIAPTDPAVPFARELWVWWSKAGADPATGHDAESNAFVRTVAALRAGGPPPAEANQFPWGRLLRAWQSPDPAAAFTALLPRRPALAAALARRAAQHPSPDLHGFLTVGPGEEPALLASEVPARTGYGVLALHPDGPVLTDLYVRQQSRIVSEFASTLFPPKGWIPAAELLQRLPPAP
jgi:O-antigen ligase